jgi:hypothetical protein
LGGRCIHDQIAGLADSGSRCTTAAACTSGFIDAAGTFQPEYDAGDNQAEHNDSKQKIYHGSNGADGFKAIGGIDQIRGFLLFIVFHIKVSCQRIFRNAL